MESLSTPEITTLLLALSVLLLVALAFGEVARWFNQPALIGELMAGILLGPSVLGHLAPGVSEHLFPATGNVPKVLDGIFTISVVLFMLVAGMELDLSAVWRQGRNSIVVSLCGLVIPFLLGLVVALLVPGLLFRNAGMHPWTFAFFFATAMAISALPVIARILLDLHLYRTDFGMLLISAAMMDDLIGWIVFAAILTFGPAVVHPFGLPQTIALVLGYAIFMLTFGRWILHWLIPWIQAYFAWPRAILGLTLALALLGAAFTEWIGVHAVFGAFLAGIAIGDSYHMREQIRRTIGHFVSFFFAPIFFAGIGLRVNFIESFDLVVCLVVLVIATIGKVSGGYLGARWCGLSKPEAFSLGFGLNARGMMEIVLGMLALRHGLIGPRLFVALVIMAIVSSTISGPIIRSILKLEKVRHFWQFLSIRAFDPRLEAATGREAIARLSALAAPLAAIPAAEIEARVWEREKMMSTALENGLAVPHARFESLTAPVIAAGLSPAGVDFQSGEDFPAHLVFLILTPAHDGRSQLEILADIAKSLKNDHLRQTAFNARNFQEFLSALKTMEHRFED